MIPTQIPPSEVLTNLASVIVAHCKAAAGAMAVTIERRHLVIAAEALIGTAERVEMLEQSDRSLDSMSRELAIARADNQRLQMELDTERYRYSIAVATQSQALADAAENVIDLTEHFAREQRGRS